MAQVGNNQDRFGGEFMIQDRDHMGDIDQSSRGNSRQADQSQSASRQQGGDHGDGGQQGSQKKRQRRVE